MQKLPEGCIISGDEFFAVLEGFYKNINLFKGFCPYFPRTIYLGSLY